MSFIEASRRRKTCLPPGRSSSRGPRVVPMAWGGCVGAAGYPMGCQIGRLTCTKRHWRDLRRPLKFPNLTISLTRFGHVLEGSPGPPGSIWRRPRHPVIDTANLGLGVRPLALSAPVYYYYYYFPLTIERMDESWTRFHSGTSRVVSCVGAAPERRSGPERSHGRNFTQLQVP